MSLTYPPNGDAAPARCRDGASNLDRYSRLIKQQDSNGTGEEQRILADLRAEHRRLRFRLVKIEIIGIAVAKGIFTPDIAAELEKGIFTSDIAAEIAGLSLWPQSLVDAAREWRIARYGRAAA